MAKQLRVNVYEVDRNYGGPEEGGWWYDTYTPRLSIKVPDKYHAKLIQKALLDEYPNEGSRYSVVPRTTDYAVLIEKHKPVYKPEHTPHYE